MLNWKDRILIYAEFFSRGEFLPIWSESASYGYGSSFPIFYHKLFYWIAAIFYLITSSMKATACLTLSIFMMTGILGTQRCITELGTKKKPALLAACALPFCNYIYTSWIVRGAFAELSAHMLIPWVLLWAIRCVKGQSGRSLFILGAWVFPSIYLAHSMIFFFCAFPVVASVIYRLTRLRNRMTFLRSLAGLSLVFMLVAGPIIYLQGYYKEEVMFFEGIETYTPRQFMPLLSAYVTHADSYTWGQHWQGYSVKLDLVLFAVIFAGIGYALYRKLSRFGDEHLPLSPAYWFLFICFAYYIFFLTPYSLSAYDFIPGFKYIQFPWRLLSFVSTLSLILAAVPLIRYLRISNNDDGRWSSLILLAIMALISPYRAPIQYEWLSKEQLEAVRQPNEATIVGGPEYFPPLQGIKNPNDAMEHASHLFPKPTLYQWKTNSYEAERIDKPAFEKGWKTYQITVYQKGTVILPITYSKNHRIQIDQHPAKAFRTPDDARLHFDLQEGVHTIRIDFPKWSSLRS